MSAALERLAGAQVVHTDEMLQGWDGLPGLGKTLDDLVRPLAAGRGSRWRAWDWTTQRWGPEQRLRAQGAGDLLVVEGVGASVGPHRDLISLVVWMDAAPQVRTARWLARDGERDLPHMERWQRSEESLHAAANTRALADLLLPG